MSRQRLPLTLERLRRRAFQRHRAQALFRKEEYHLTEEYWNEIWTQDRFSLRGMRGESICLTRRNPSQPWQPGNLVLMTRQQQLDMNNKSLHEIAVDHILARAIWRDYV